MAIEHGLFLLDSQMEEIIDIVLEMHNENPEKCTMDNPQRNPHTMKTAMQEMFDELHAHSFEIPIGLLAKCEELMEKEKEQLERAWQDGAETAQNDAAKEIRNNYTPNKL